jgi:hypothetical protein
MLAGDVEGIPAFVLDEAELRGVQKRERERQRSADEFALGRYVTIEGLTKSAELNGSVAEVVGQVQKGQEWGQMRVPVRLMEAQKRTLLVKLCTLRPFDAQQCVRAVRLSANGEKRGLADVLVPQTVLTQYYLPHANLCPIPQLLGAPLYTCRVKPYCLLKRGRDLDNQWATIINVMPDNGIARPEWQSDVGAVLVFRPKLEPLSSDDVCLMHGYLWGLMDVYADGEITDAHLNGEEFEEFQMRRLEEQEEREEEEREEREEEARKEEEREQEEREEEGKEEEQDIPMDV